MPPEQTRRFLMRAMEAPNRTQYIVHQNGVPAGIGAIGYEEGEATVFGLAVSPEWERLSARVASMPCLTIAALNGTAAGGSLGMVLACDLRLAVPQAKFFYPVMRLGFLPRPGDPERLTALVGPSRAKMILMAGHKIAADEALACGLVDRLVPAEDLLAVAEAMATDALGASREHVVAIKSLIR